MEGVTMTRRDELRGERREKTGLPTATTSGRTGPSTL